MKLRITITVQGSDLPEIPVFESDLVSPETTLELSNKGETPDWASQNASETQPTLAGDARTNLPQSGYGRETARKASES